MSAPARRVGTLVAIVSAHRTTWAPLRRWRVRQGGSSADLLAVDYAAAVERAARIGFPEPDSVVLQEG